MCGIFGAVSLTPMTVKVDGKKTKVHQPWDMGIVRGLAWANRERGTDSLGFFDSSGRMVKRASDPMEAMQDEKVRKWVANSNQHTWAIGGHTRYATQGSVTKANAHPFKYGHIIGSHNGMVQAPNEYIVDSEYLFDVIRKNGYKGLEAVRGYWGLSWYDLNEGCFYLTQHRGSLHYAIDRGVLYYSSSDKHLQTFVDVPTKEVKEGQVLKVLADGTILDSEQSHIEGIKAGADYWDWDGWEGSRYGYYGQGVTNYPKTGRGASKVKDSTATTQRTDGLVRTYTSYTPPSDGTTTTTKDGTAVVDDWNGNQPDEWNAAWDKYFHSMSDDEFKAWDTMA